MLKSPACLVQVGPVASHMLGMPSAMELNVLKSEPLVPVLSPASREVVAGIYITLSVDIYNISVPQKELKDVSTQFLPQTGHPCIHTPGLQTSLSSG